MAFPVLALQPGIIASGWSHQRAQLHEKAPGRGIFPDSAYRGLRRCWLLQGEPRRAQPGTTLGPSLSWHGWTQLFRRLGSRCHRDVLGRTARSLAGPATAPSPAPAACRQELGGALPFGVTPARRWGDATLWRLRGRGWKKLFWCYGGAQEPRNAPNGVWRTDPIYKRTGSM